MDFNDLAYFVYVVDHKGFAPAGRALGIPKSKLSRRVSELEERIGVRLLQRSTRHFSVTAIGRVYYAHCKAMMEEAIAAEESIEAVQSEPRGVIRISCPVELLYERVNDMLVAYMVKYPDVELHIQAMNRPVDVVDEGIDIAIRVRPPPLQDSDLIMRVFGERKQCLVASPSLISKHGEPSMPADLGKLPSLDLGVPQSEHVWKLSGPDSQSVRIHHQPKLVTRAMLTLRAAAVSGLGVVQLPHMMVHRQLAEGQLIHLLPDWSPSKEVIHAVFSSRRGLLPAIRELIEHLAQSFQELNEE